MLFIMKNYEEYSKMVKFYFLFFHFFIELEIDIRVLCCTYSSQMQNKGFSAFAVNDPLRVEPSLSPIMRSLDCASIKTCQITSYSGANCKSLVKAYNFSYTCTVLVCTKNPYIPVTKVNRFTNKLISSSINIFCQSQV